MNATTNGKAKVESVNTKVKIECPTPAELVACYDAEEDEFKAIGRPSKKLKTRIDELVTTLKDGAEVTLYRDWEGMACAVIEGDDRFESLYLTDEGRVAWGGINLPEFYDTVAEYLEAA